MQPGLIFGLESVPECFVCGRLKSLEVHHLDGEHLHDSALNRILLCRGCHVAVHRFDLLTRQEFEVWRKAVREMYATRCNADSR